MITFFVDPGWRHDKSQHIPLLFPFWGNALDPARVPFWHALFDRYGFDTNCYAVTDDIASCDLVLMPYSHNTVLREFPDLLSRCHAAAHTRGMLLLIDGVGDIEHQVNLPGVIVLRYGGYRFERKEYEIYIPPYADDLLVLYGGGTLQLRRKQEKPVLAFTGWGELSPLQHIRSVAKELPDRMRGFFDSRYQAKKKGVFFRIKAISILRRSARIVCNFIIRSSYSGHADMHIRDPEAVRREFVENLLAGDYGLDIRGDANASTRLFEMLSLGRIPVIVDTERNFPFSDVVDYASFSLTVDFRDLKKLPERIAEFHKKISPERFEAMQRNAREAYLHYFRVDAMTHCIVAELHAILRRRVLPSSKNAEE